jgi:hypothetical protein
MAVLDLLMTQVDRGFVWLLLVDSICIVCVIFLFSRPDTNSYHNSEFLRGISSCLIYGGALSGLMDSSGAMVLRPVDNS